MLALARSSHILAAIAFLFLSGLLAVAWEGQRQGLRLITASVATAAWGTVLAYQPFLQPWPASLLIADVMRQGAWLVVFFGLALAARGWTAALATAALVAGVGFLTTWVGIIGGIDFATAVFGGGVTLAIVGLLLLVRAYVVAPPRDRGAVGFFCAGLIPMLACDLALYGNGVLTHEFNVHGWAARGVVFAVAVPFVAVAARRNSAWSINLFASRRAMMLLAGSLLIAALLLTAAAAGYLVDRVLGSGSEIAERLFVVAAAGLLVAMAASPTLRRRFRVLLTKNFYRYKYDYRDEWLRFVATLSDVGEGQDPCEPSIRAIAQIVASPAGVLLRYDELRESFTLLGAWPPGVDAEGGWPELLEDRALRTLIRERHWVIDLREHAPAASPGTPGAGATRWRVLVPILLRNELFGLLVLADPRDRFELTFEDRDLLSTAARHIATFLAQHEAEQRFAELQQFEAYSKLTAFLMHDLKNSVAKLQLVVTNAARHKHNPAFIDDAIDTADNTAQHINRLIEQLRRGHEVERPRPVDLVPLLETVVAGCAGRAPQPTYRAAVPSLVVNAAPGRITDIVGHVIRNAQDATAADGRVEVRTVADATRARIEVEDTGSGMTAEFIRQRLFRPFDSTKGAKGMGIGAYQAREYVRSVGGDVEVRSLPGHGTVFTIIIPVCDTVPRD